MREICSEDDRLLVQVVDREGEVIGSWASERFSPTCDGASTGCELSASRLIPDRSLFRGELFGSEGTFIAGRVVAGVAGASGVPRGCEDATHALVIGVGEDSRFAKTAPNPHICLIWRP